MQRFWDEPILIHPSKKNSMRHHLYMTADLSAQDCQYYGHSWQAVGMAGTKCCTVCGIKGYCPGCTPISPTKDARPFSCTKHTPRQNQEVQV